MARQQPVSADDQRRQQIRASWDAYYGKFTPPLRKVRGADDNVYVNRCRGIVDVGVDFLFGKDLSLKLPQKAKKSAQAYLDNVWEANKTMSKLQDAATNGGVAGHPFIRLVQDNPFPRLVVMDPSTVTMVSDPNDVDHITSYIVDWDSVDPKTGDPVQRRQLINQEPDGKSWTIADLQRTSSSTQPGATNGSQWTPMGPPATWGYAWAPIHHCKNLPAPNQLWGLPDLTTDIIQLNKDINFIVSNMARIIRFHAHPKTVGKGFAADQVKVGVDDMIVLPTKDGTIEILEMKGDLASSQTLMDKLLAAMDALSQVPSIALGLLADIPKGTISGIALAILYAPILEKTDKKRRAYGEMIVELFTHILEMGGFTNQGTIEIHWPDLLPVDPVQAATAAQLQLALGFSHDTVLRKLGANPEEEAKKRAAEADDPTLKKSTPPVAQPAPAVTSGADMPAPGTGEVPPKAPKQDAQADADMPDAA